MATAKKKASAKRTVKYAAKAQSSARQTTAQASNWVNKNASSAAADWQKGANEWAQQSAKLYQLPFAQGDMNAASQKAAETVKSATENMVKMGNDMMQQMFSGAQQGAKAGSAKAAAFDPSSYFKQFQSQMPQFDVASLMKQFQQKIPNLPNFDLGALQEKFASASREASDQLSKASQAASRTAAEAMEAGRENVAAVTEVCNVATSVSKELAAEAISFINKQFSQNVELSKQVLTCRTLNDMFDLSTRITKANLDAFFSESVKISEMVFQCATDVSEPLNDAVSATSERLSKAMAS